MACLLHDLSTFCYVTIIKIILSMETACYTVLIIEIIWTKRIKVKTQNEISSNRVDFRKKWWQKNLLRILAELRTKNNSRIVQFVRNSEPKFYPKNWSFSIFSQSKYTPKLRNRLMSKLYQSESLKWHNKGSEKNSLQKIARLSILIQNKIKYLKICF